MKQFKFRLIALIMLLCSIVKGYAHYDFMVDGICYNIKSDTKVIVTYIDYDRKNISYGVYYVYYNRDVEYVGAITIPSKVAFENVVYDVVSIGDNAFYGCNSLTSITLPEGVTSIGSHAFSGCSSLTSITLPEGVTSIGERAFYNCSNLIAIVVAEGNKVYDSRNGCNAIIETADNTLIAGCSTTIIPESVTSIGDYAFYGRSRLTSITLPECVTSIGERAFYNCSSLYKVLNYSSLPISKGSEDYGYVAYYAMQVLNVCELNVIGDYQFYTSNGIHYLANYTGDEKSLILPDSYNGENYMIDDYAFYGCSRLTSITLPSSVTSIGNYAFEGCTALKEVVIEDGSETLSLGYNYYNSRGAGEGLFYDCPLESVYLGRNLSYNSGSSYGYSPFYNKEKLTTLTIGDNVTSLGSYAFYGCSLYSVTIPNGVLSIGSNTFSTPEKVIWLTNTPPTGYANANGSINYVANDQYANLSNTKVYPYLSSMFEVEGVKYVPVSPSERTCHAIDCAYDSTAGIINVSETTSFKGVAMKVTEVMPYTFYGNNHIKEVAISHLGNIGNYAFYNCDSIKIVSVSNQGNIGSQAFCDCDGIESVIVSNQGGVGSQAFYNCDGIKDVNVSNLGDIDSQAFYNCDAIESVKVSNQGNIGEQAFYDCNGIKTIDVRNRGIICDQAFSGCTSLRTVTLGDSIGSLGYKEFYQCTSLQEIVIPDSVKTVGEYCFSGCSAMKRAAIGDGVSNIAAYTFQGCTALEDVVVGDGITTISNYAFRNCSSLPEISIPQATTTIGNYVFSGCSKLADVIIENRSTALNLGSNGSSALFADCPLDSVYIGGKITYSTTSSYGYSPFYRNTSLRTVVITDREEQVYENEFYGCTNLQNVTIGNGVKAIGNYAFSGCSSLEGFSFGSSMESIGAEAFSDCTNLTSITSHAAVPPTCGTQALDDINKWNCTLRVPIGYATAYQAAEQWKEFFFVEDVVEVTTYVLTYMVDGVVYHTEALAHKAPITAIAEPTKEGYTFSGWGEVPETMPAQDITIYGTFAINKYMVSFVVDGVVMAANELEYGSAITVPTMPEREGYTFSGWGEVDETVPAHDVTYEACYVVNVYRVFYFVGTKLVHTADVAYGEAIPEYVYEPTEEGDVFVGWIGESYDTMPAHDVTYTANITNDVLQWKIDNGQLTIYDLSGRKVTDAENLKGGIYIVNGKKVVINNK